MSRLSFVSLTLLFSARLSLCGTDNCDSALVMTTYKEGTSEHVDWRKASLVTRNDYDEIKHDAGLNVVIYGVPVGASYEDFEKRVRSGLKSLQESVSQDYARNVLWTGLTPTGANAYHNCLRAKAAASRGLHLDVLSATASDISLLATWVPVNQDLSEIPVSWSGASPDLLAHLPDRLVAGERIIPFPRPAKEYTLAVSYLGMSDAVTLTPLPLEPVDLRPSPYFLSEVGIVIGTPELHGDWYQDGAYWSLGKVVFNGQSMSHSFGLHPLEDRPSRVEFEVPSHAKVFSSTVAIGGTESNSCNRGEARAVVKFGDFKAWEAVIVGSARKPSSSSVVQSGPNMVQTSDIPVPIGASRIELSVFPLGDYKNMDDCVLWIAPQFR